MFPAVVRKVVTCYVVKQLSFASETNAHLYPTHLPLLATAITSIFRAPECMNRKLPVFPELGDFEDPRVVQLLAKWEA
jgi:hypothetical protein